MYSTSNFLLNGAFMRPIKIGIIGCGKVAHFHAKAINNLLNCCLVAACNHSEAKLQNFCETYKINSYLTPEEMIEKLEEMGIPTVIASHALSGVGRGITNKYGGYSPIDIIADTLRMFSHGIKVCAEISIMAADAGLIPVGEEVLAIGGRAKGVDSAAILTPANMTGVFDLRFHEILAMPRP